MKKDKHKIMVLVYPLFVGFVAIFFIACNLHSEKSYSIKMQGNNLYITMPHPICIFGPINWRGVELSAVVEDVFKELQGCDLNGDCSLYVRFEISSTDKYGNPESTYDERFIVAIPINEAKKYKDAEHLNSSFSISKRIQELAFPSREDFSFPKNSYIDIPYRDTNVDTTIVIETEPMVDDISNINNKRSSDYSIQKQLDDTDYMAFFVTNCYKATKDGTVTFDEFKSNEFMRFDMLLIYGELALMWTIGDEVTPMEDLQPMFLKISDLYWESMKKEGGFIRFVGKTVLDNSDSELRIDMYGKDKIIIYLKCKSVISTFYCHDVQNINMSKLLDYSKKR